MATAMFTATLQCYHTDSLFAGVSICVSISAGLFCGIKGKPLHFHTKDGVALSFTLYVSVSTVLNHLRTEFMFSPFSCASLKDDDWRTGSANPGHLY